MKGTHTVVVERAKVKYTLTFKRNISFIRGNSGTGKTTLISMIRDYNDRGPESGVALSCDVPCETLSGRRWERELSIIEDSIVFLDEGNEFIYSKDFAKAVNGSSNYFVLISRRDANELPYSVDEILKLVNTTSKTINGRKSDRRFYSVTKPLYDHTASMLYQDLNVGFEVPDAVVVEDSKSGYQFYDALCNRLRIPCYTATGVANLKRTIHECPERNVLPLETAQRLVPTSKRCSDSAFTRTFACSSRNHLSGHFCNLASFPVTTFQKSSRTLRAISKVAST